MTSRPAPSGEAGRHCCLFPELSLGKKNLLRSFLLLSLFLFQTAPAWSAITETTTAAGLSGTTSAAPGANNIQIFSIGLTGDGSELSLL